MFTPLCFPDISVVRTPSGSPTSSKTTKIIPDFIRLLLSLAKPNIVKHSLQTITLLFNSLFTELKFAASFSALMLLYFQEFRKYLQSYLLGGPGLGSTSPLSSSLSLAPADLSLSCPPMSSVFTRFGSISPHNNNLSPNDCKINSS